jgi:hypothetical protein
MKTYARIQSGHVVELFQTQADIASLFHQGVKWVEVQSPEVDVGWIEGVNGLAPPPPPPSPPPASGLEPLVTLGELRAQLTELAAKVAALSSP